MTPARVLACVSDMPRAGVYEFHVYDVMGREVARPAFYAICPLVGQEVRMPDDDIRVGVYFIVGRSGSLSATTKLVIIR
jgi:hypothetical protein